jgi:hypothetical protein
MEWISTFDDRKPQCSDDIKLKYINLLSNSLEEVTTSFCCCFPHGFGIEGFDEFIYDLNLSALKGTRFLIHSSQLKGSSSRLLPAIPAASLLRQE